MDSTKKGTAPRRKIEGNQIESRRIFLRVLDWGHWRVGWVEESTNSGRPGWMRSRRQRFAPASCATANNEDEIYLALGSYVGEDQRLLPVMMTMMV
jgi:hypothetical protein